MLQTIEVHIDTNGYIHPIEPIRKLPTGQALLTLLDHTVTPSELEIKLLQSFDDLFGILTTTHTVSLDDMEQTIAQQGLESLNDCN